MSEPESKSTTDTASLSVHSGTTDVSEKDPDIDSKTASNAGKPVVSTARSMKFWHFF